MIYQWHWAAFFQDEIDAPKMTIPQIINALPSLPFTQGLQVIVTSVPAFAHNQWRELHMQLAALYVEHKHLDYLLLIGSLIRECLTEARRLLDYDIEYAIVQAQRLLNDGDAPRQLALMACLRHYAQSSMQAQMMYGYLLQNYDHEGAQLDDILAFYQGLTPRQREVAALVAGGLTNREIAEVLVITPKVVAEHLTEMFGALQTVIGYKPDKHGTRYRLIHWLTRLFETHPYLQREG